MIIIIINVSTYEHADIVAHTQHTNYDNNHNKRKYIRTCRYSGTYTAHKFIRLDVQVSLSTYNLVTKDI